MCRFGEVKEKGNVNNAVLVNVSFFVFHLQKRKKLSKKLPKEIKKNFQILKNWQKLKELPENYPKVCC